MRNLARLLDLLDLLDKLPSRRLRVKDGARRFGKLRASSKGERLRRKLFTLFAAISLLLCVASAVLWSLSYRHGIASGRLGFDTASQTFVDIESMRGELKIKYVRSPAWMASPTQARRTTGWFVEQRDQWEPMPEGSVAGFGHAHEVSSTVNYRGWWIPFWSVTTLFGIAPVMFVLRKRLARHAGFALEPMPIGAPDVPPAKANA